MAITVVIVDDMGDMRVLMRQIIAGDAELDVVGEAGSGREALSLVRRVGPDVVVIDQEMPEIDGLETARLILADHPGLPIVLLSSQLDEGLRSRAESVGVTSCHSKFILRDLCDVIRQARSPGGAAS